MAQEFRLPTLQEGIASATVVKILVAVGDTIAVGDPVIEVETDKASVEVPSGVAGTVQAIHVTEGQQVTTGTLILTVAEASAPAAAPPQAPEAPVPAPQPAAPPPAPQPEPEPEQPAPQPAPEQAARAEQLVVAAQVTAATPASAGADDEAAPPRRTIPAAPSVRRFAREIGIDIAQVPGTGPGGRISIEDVKAYARRLAQAAAGAAAPAAAAPAATPATPLPAAEAAAPARAAAAAEQLPDFTKWGPVERVPMSGVRRTAAHRLSQAWVTIPHVTHHDKADITEMEKFRKQYAPRVEAAGGKLTMTAILIKVLTAALKEFPQFNASVDMAANEIVYKKYYHIGVAVDTDRGLLVPVIRDADRKSLTQIAVELGEIAARAREKKLTLEDMSGATFTISNLGGIGGEYFTPIVNWPEVAIMGVARSRIEPVYIDGQFVPRTMLPLSLSYDHRIIDGADAARFMRWVIRILEDPLLLALEG